MLVDQRFRVRPQAYCQNRDTPKYFFSRKTNSFQRSNLGSVLWTFKPDQKRANAKTVHACLSAET